MGWTFTSGANKADIIRELNEPKEWNGRRSSVLASCVRGSTLWQLWETVHPAPGATPERWIMCNLLEKQPDYGWGYKDIDQSMGPCDVSCPLSYVDRVTPTDSEYANNWFANVRDHHARAARAKGLRENDVIVFAEPIDFGGGDRAKTFKLENQKKLYFYAVEMGMVVRLHKETLTKREWALQ